MNKRERMIWSTTCNSCFSNFAAWPHWEADDDIPAPEEWGGPRNCPVCSHYLDWEFGDPMTTHIRTGYTPMSNQDRAAKVIDRHGFDPCREPECIAQDLADAGLLAPDALIRCERCRDLV